MQKVGINQTDMGKVLGIRQCAVSLLLNNRRSMSLNEAAKIADTLGVSIARVYKAFHNDGGI